MRLINLFVVTTALVILSNQPCRAGLVYTTDFNNLTPPTILNTNGKLIYTQVAVSDMTAISGSGMLTFANQTLNVGNIDKMYSAGASPTYNINIFDIATNQIKSIKLGGGVSGILDVNTVGLLTSFKLADPTKGTIQFADGVSVTVLNDPNNPYVQDAFSPLQVQISVTGLASVPEPSSLILVSIAGLGAIGASWRRRRGSRRA